MGTRLIMYSQAENEKRKQNQSDKIKARWVECEIIATKIGVSKDEVFNNYKDIQSLIPGVMRGNPDAYESMLKTINNRKQKPKIYNHIAGEHKKSDIQNLKLMLWTIGQFDSPEEVTKYFNAACVALKELK